MRRLVGSVNQLRFNDNRGEVSFFGQKMIILRRDVIRVIREGLERLVGEQATPFLSYLASGIGVHEGSIFRDSTTNSHDKVSMTNMVQSALEDTNLGLGRIRIVKADFDSGTANLTISNCFEAIENGPSEAPNCTFTSGFLAGMFAEVFDKTVQAIEVKCISHGGTECEFQISPTSDGIPEEEVESEQPKETKPAPPETKPVTLKPDTASKPQSNVSSDVKKQVAPSMPGKNTGDAQSDFDSGVERASRLAKRKDRFWNKWFR